MLFLQGPPVLIVQTLVFTKSQLGLFAPHQLKPVIHIHLVPHNPLKELLEVTDPISSLELPMVSRQHNREAITQMVNHDGSLTRQHYLV